MTDLIGKLDTNMFGIIRMRLEIGWWKRGQIITQDENNGPPRRSEERVRHCFQSQDERGQSASAVHLHKLLIRVR